MSRSAIRKVRAFVAVEAPSSVCFRVKELVSKLKKADANVRWEAPENMHVTLKFLGEIELPEAPKICAVVNQVAQQFDSFDVAFSHFGAFPNIESPDVLWVGMKEGAEILRELHKRLDDALYDDLGFSRERRRFSPHLTIGRVQQSNENLTRLLHTYRDFAADFLEVEEMTLYATMPDGQGRRYEPLGHARLLASASDARSDLAEIEEEFEN